MGALDDAVTNEDCLCVDNWAVACVCVQRHLHLGHGLCIGALDETVTNKASICGGSWAFVYVCIEGHVHM